MKTVSLKLAATLEQELAATARKRGTSKSEILRTALRLYLDEEALGIPESCLALAGDLIGAAEGPEDLSANKEHLQDFGK